MNDQPSFIVIDLVTGCADGHYTNKSAADASRVNLSRRHKGGMWVTALIVSNPGNHYLPDSTFHAIQMPKNNG